MVPIILVGRNGYVPSTLLLLQYSLSIGNFISYFSPFHLEDMEFNSITVVTYHIQCGSFKFSMRSLYLHLWYHCFLKKELRKSFHAVSDRIFCHGL